MKRRFIVDENLPERLADVLGICFKDTDVTSVKRLLGPGRKDVEWMRDLADYRPCPVILTCDRRIQTRELERKALRESGLTFIVMRPSWMNMRFDEQVWRLLRMWPKICELIGKLGETYGVVEVEVKRGLATEHR